MVPESASKGLPTRRLALLLITLAVIAAYSNSFFVPFLYDDDPNIVQSRSIRSLTPITTVLFPGEGSHVGGRPLMNLSFAVNYAISGLSVWSYHVFNLLVHLLAALALFGFFRRTLLTPVLGPRFGRHANALAMAVALLWAVHPLHTEAVTYITQRAESMMGLFLFLVFYVALRGWERRRPWPWHLSAGAAMILGGASKEVMVVAPFLVYAFDAIFIHRTPENLLKRSPVLYGALAVGLTVLLAQVATGATSESTPEAVSTPFTYLVTETTVILHYLRLAFWPNPLIFDYGWMPRTLGEAWPHALAVTLLFSASVWAVARRMPAGFAGLWFFFILAPTSSIMPLPFFIWERRMYLPLAAVLALVVLSVHSLMVFAAEKSGNPHTFRRLATAAMAAALAVAVGLSEATYLRNHDYRSELAIWEDTVAKRPENARGHTSLGYVLAGMGREKEATEQYRIAVGLDPPTATAFVNLGAAVARKGNREQALEYFRRALEIYPLYGEAHSDLAGLLTDMGRYEEALSHASVAVSVRPDYPPAWFNLGTLLARNGKNQEAVEALERTIALDAGLVEARVNLAMLYRSMKEPDLAATQARKAVEMSPGLAHAWRVLGEALAETGDHRRAGAAYARSLLLDPNSLFAVLGLAAAAEGEGNRDKAALLYESALKKFPDNPEANLKMGIFLLKQSKGAMAAPYFEKALAVRPDYAPAHTNLGVVLLLAGEKEKALLHFRKALEKEPRDAGALANVGIALAQMGRLGESAGYLNKALSINPDLATARTYLERMTKKQDAK